MRRESALGLVPGRCAQDPEIQASAIGAVARTPGKAGAARMEKRRFHINAVFSGLRNGVSIFEAEEGRRLGSAARTCAFS